MPLSRQFTCPFPGGIHARPASALEEFVRKFHSRISLVNERTQRTADAKSILSIVSADIRLSDSCVFQITGPDEQQAMAELTIFLQEKFPHSDTPLTGRARSPSAPRETNGIHGGLGETALPSGKQINGDPALPPCLRNAAATVHPAAIVVPGIAQGIAVFAGINYDLASLPRPPPAAPALEWARVEAALKTLVSDCDQKIATLSGIESDLLKVRRSIANDPEFQKLLHREITRRNRPAADALQTAETHFTAMLDATGNALLRERALDIQDVCRNLARLIFGDAATNATTPEINLQSDSIVFAESLTPGQFLALDRKFLKGLVLARASKTSHTAILARSFGIPAIALAFDKVEAASRRFSESGKMPLPPFDPREVIVDANIGALVTNLTDPARRYYALEHRRVTGRRAHLQRLASHPAATPDGHPVGVVANIATSGEAAAAFENGAEGIGLFRTEMLFLDRQTPPGEPEQFDTYRAVLSAADSRPVVIRTLDIGGDKPLAWLNLPREENPFLGFRAVRMYPHPQFEPLFRAQIRALVRASAHGNLRVMIPMIATIGEARWVRRVIAEEQQKCAAEKIPFNAAMQTGAMIEIPAAAFSMDALAAEFDFFSIGSNDLLQYFMAADRSDARLAPLYNPLQPAFLRLLAQIANAARERQKEISLCGELDAQAKILPLLVGLGLDKISASAPMLPMLKTELASLSQTECRDLLAQTLRCSDAGEVAALLAQFSAKHAPPLLDLDLIITDSDAATKEEAIKQAADLMFVQGRADDSRAVEEAIWLRESQYTTGFGYGFAIPHCKNDAVRHNSLVLLKTRAPLPWNSLDGAPVRVVLLLAIRESETTSAAAHMKLLAQLARKIMDENFRAELERETAPPKLLALLHRTLIGASPP